MQVWRLDGVNSTLALASDGGIPFVTYWGSALSPAADLVAIAQANAMDVTGGMLDSVPPIRLCPQTSETFPGQVGLSVADKEGNALYPRFVLSESHNFEQSLIFECADVDCGVRLTLTLRMDTATDVIALSSSFYSQEKICVSWLSAPVLPAANNSQYVLEFSGRWCKEFQVNQVPWSCGARLRESTSGRTSHENTPHLIIPQTGCTNSQGLAHGFHYAWSGGHRMLTEELADGRRQVQFGHASEAARPLVTEVHSSVLYACFSEHGLNGLAQSFQQFVREHIVKPVPSQKNTPPPVFYNCWEGVYFDHDIDQLKAIATCVHGLGVERFVLDDGWFGQRNDDTSSLGDWQVDPNKYPEGLTPLVDHVKSLGMSFGLWFEPEMINPDSDLYRAHPDWILGDAKQALGRDQMALNLALPQVFDYLLKAVSAILNEYDIDYIKWDHNRVLPYANAKQTENFYRLLDCLREKFPTLEVESCASGGARIDYGVLTRTQRFWLSDCNDAMERLVMQHNAALFYPPEITGSHIGPRNCHTTGRHLSIASRAWVAASRQMGIEMDPAELTQDEADVIKKTITWYKKQRQWLQYAKVLRLDSDDPAMTGEMIIEQSGENFVVLVGKTQTSAQILPKPVRLTGLEPDAQYSISIFNETKELGISRGNVALATQTLTLEGQFLMNQGVQLPCAFPDTICMLEGKKININQDEASHE